ncbi:Fc.00g017260.m01.CDS01 [Cosmosporella sp. VM-42]
MGQFDWFKKIGATDEAVAVLNDQPILFTILLVALVGMILQGVLIWYINYATMKPEQRKKKDKKDKKPAARK